MNGKVGGRVLWTGYHAFFKAIDSIILQSCWALKTNSWKQSTKVRAKEGTRFVLFFVTEEQPESSCLTEAQGDNRATVGKSAMKLSVVETDVFLLTEHLRVYWKPLTIFQTSNRMIQMTSGCSSDAYVL